ncbi:DNA mismatch repair endonuclease MutL [Mastigocoleus testarum]|uniref:DNA mismatch repair protein MutL n=1 Tax=Mastigocoleus testarum BC008 TaxID=371196 RepID=A0A0V7ZPT7_9CYAN|nr:DNA mismatch repair endonuclease MutL [Mastigocoleus testarum]KST66595.1 DNA mismatch repair protein MutL [Mastigocoleus testarum BC008]
MASTIQELPTELVHLIAAGEVIDSFAAVVRELVENSLDAGATRIVISIWPSQWRLTVADNGCGMNWEDLQRAAIPHSTSKIRTCGDLWKINSLGFRGEALHSLTTLGSLEILSRPSTGDIGRRAVYDSEGKIVFSEVAAIAPGTVVTVSELFGKFLARRRGLPAMARQIKAVQKIIEQIALCHPQLTWQVWQNDRKWFSLCPATSTAKLLPQILPRLRNGDLEELQLKIPDPLQEYEEISLTASSQIDSQVNSVKNSPTSYRVRENSSKVSPILSDINEKRGYSTLNLVLGLPDRCHRHRPDWVRVAVNGRMVKSPELEQTIVSSLARTLPRDRYPLCLLHYSISPEQVDWNRNPAKSKIYLKQIGYWQKQVEQAIERALRINADTIKFSVQNTRVSKLIKAAESKAAYHVESQNSINGEEANSTVDINASNTHSLNINGSNLHNSNLRNSNLSNSNLNNSPSNIQFLKAVAQVNKTYIVAEHPGGVWLVEQHIAHERVLYEQLCDRWKLVPVEPAIILYQLSTAQVEQLQHIGIDIEPFGDRLWAVRSIPGLLQNRDDCAEALIELSWGGDLQTAQVAVACRSAIRNGTPLSLEQMQSLLDDWLRTRNPHTCPHGRPIYLSLSESSLSKYFRRHWVIGKSHGI